MLDYQDSNLDKQNQNLLCYHYTIVQSLVLFSKSDAKIGFFCDIFQMFAQLFYYKPPFSSFCRIYFPIFEVNLEDILHSL